MAITRDVIQQARKADLVAYLESKGYKFIRQGNRYKCIDPHSSLVITNRNAYYWNSKGESGNSIDFLMRNFNMDFETTIEELTNTLVVDNKKDPSQLGAEKSPDYKVSKDQINRAFAYLNKQRNIDNTIIANLVDKNHLFMVSSDKYKYPVIGFTIFDEALNTTGYELQGTFDRVKFKGLTPDAKYGYGFNIRIGNPKEAYFFESAVDLLSFYQLWKHNALKIDLKGTLLVSMAGLKVNTLTNTLRAFKIDSKPSLCIDNDNAASKFKNKLREANISFKDIDIPNSNAKDWNEYLSITLN